MDDLDLIRSLRADPRAVDLESRDRARARVQRHAAGRHARRRPPRLFTLAAVALLLTGAIAVAVLNAGTARPREATKPAATPAELLRQAASAARAAPPEPALTTGYWYSRVDRLEARGGPYRHDLRFREERWTNLAGRGRMRIDLRSVRFPRTSGPTPARSGLATGGLARTSSTSAACVGFPPTRSPSRRASAS